MSVIDLALRQTPGAFLDHKTREIPAGLIEFEYAPVGWLTKTGEPRQRDHRAYYFTPSALTCPECDGTGRVAGRSANGKKCKPCDGSGNASKRRRFPSVTTLLNAICPKGGLPPWYEARGIEGAIEAVRRGLLNVHDPAHIADAVEIVRGAMLGADRARDDAAGRGLDVHRALEEYMQTGEPPRPQDIRPEHHGYYQALVRFLLDHEPEPEAVEELVVHPEDGFAGRFDLLARMPKLGGSLTLCDAKTQENGGIYLTAHAQVNLYEHGRRWCGDEPAERLLIVVFAANGEYRIMPADHPEAFTNAALAWLEHGRPVDMACANINARERKTRAQVAA